MNTTLARCAKIGIALLIALAIGQCIYHASLFPLLFGAGGVTDTEE